VLRICTATISLLVTFLLVPAASLSNTFPAPLAHGFGAGFSDSLSDQDHNDPDARLQRTLSPGQITVDVDPGKVSRSARWEVDPTDSANHDLLVKIVQPLRTVTEMSDGRVIDGAGSAFAVGSKLITAMHNLDGPQNQHVARHYAMYAGTALSASQTLPLHDVASMPIPDQMCAEVCNQLSHFASLSETYPEQTIIWAQHDRDEPLIMQASVIGFAALAPEGSDGSAVRPGSCNDNLVVLVDLPFEPGSSGGPVLDLATGKLMGMVLGTLEELTLESGVTRAGFFKPAACISDLLN